MFKVSVKGIVRKGSSYLLRVNERQEYELLGGKLELEDQALAHRVRQEFLEESGVVVEPTKVLEPWFYVFGDRAVLIVPLQCDVMRVPKTLFDQDGGRLEWVESERLDSIAMPRGYLASIRQEQPDMVCAAGRPGPVYPDDLFDVTLSVHHPHGEELYPVDEPCAFARRLESMGYHEASFRTVDYGSGSDLRVVFDAGEAPVR